VAPIFDRSWSATEFKGCPSGSHRIDDCVLLRPRSSNRDDNLRRPRDSPAVATKSLPAIGWPSSPRQCAEGLSSTPSPRRASGRRVRRSPLTELRLRRESKKNKHVCFTAAYRIQSGRLVSRVSLLVRDVALLWRRKPQQADLDWPELYREEYPCRSSARHQRVPSKVKQQAAWV
jgi:hypothetical protein